MKKYFLLALVVLTGIVSSCKYDDDEVWDSVNDLANRVTELEAVTKQINNDIAAMQSIVTALQNRVAVSEVEELADGYIIHFSDGTKATIKNGKDGEDGVDGKDALNAPVINVAQINGVYYWTITLDGQTEWLTDEDGNKLPVSGTDGADGEDGMDGSSGANGKDGNTPLLKVDAEGYWTVSYDDGKNYNRVKDTDGNDVKAKGEIGNNGDSKFQKIEKSTDDGIVIITLSDGTGYKLPLLAAVTYSGNGVEGNVVTVTSGVSTTITYNVTTLNNYSVEVIKGSGKITIKVDEQNKRLILTATEEGKLVILYYNANQTITSVLNVQITKGE